MDSIQMKTIWYDSDEQFPHFSFYDEKPHLYAYEITIPENLYERLMVARDAAYWVQETLASFDKERRKPEK